MFKNCLALIPFAFILLAVSACKEKRPQAGPAGDTLLTSSARQKVTSTGVVKVECPGVDVSRGNSADVTVRLAVAPGYHINANPPTFTYLKATELVIETTNGIAPDKPLYPTPVTKKLAFEEKPLAVYEGDVPIKVRLHASDNAGKGRHRIPASLRVQACDDQACYPPGTIEATIPVTVK